MNQYLNVEEHGKVLLLRINDPETRNSIRGETMEEFLSEIARFENSKDLRCLVLTGTDPAFCTGANVPSAMRPAGGEQQPELPPKPWDALKAAYEKRANEDEKAKRSAITTLMHLQKPSIAAVNGYAVASGSGLALACDIRIMSDKAFFSETFVGVGGVAEDGSLWQLPRMIGLSNSYWQAYTGDRANAETCLRWGLVSKVVPHDELMKTTMELADKLSEGPTYAMGLMKGLIQQSLFLTPDEGMRLARAAVDIARATYDHPEGMKALRERRKPNFEGR